MLTAMLIFNIANDQLFDVEEENFDPEKQRELEEEMVRLKKQLQDIESRRAGKYYSSFSLPRHSPDDHQQRANTLKPRVRN